MKSYTDIKQSKKLAEFLPIDSADHHYVRKVTDYMGNPVDDKWSHPKYGNPNSKYAIYFVQNFTNYETLPCWSLAALLNILHSRQNDIPSLSGGGYKDGNYTSDWCLDYEYDNGDYQKTFADNPVDACVEMIIKLKELTIEQKEQAACGVDLNEDLRGTYIQGYRQAIDDVCEWIGQQHEMLEDCFSDVNDFADLVREATLNKVQVINETYYLSGPLTGTHKEFVDRQIDNIRNRLKEIYGEVLPEKLDKQIGYIVSETYKTTRNHCAQVWNVPPKEGW